MGSHHGDDRPGMLPPSSSGSFNAPTLTICKRGRQGGVHRRYDGMLLPWSFGCASGRHFRLELDPDHLQHHRHRRLNHPPLQRLHLNLAAHAHRCAPALARITLTPIITVIAAPTTIGPHPNAWLAGRGAAEGFPHTPPG